MSFKIFFLLLAIAVNLFLVHAKSKWEGRRCIPKTGYNDGCNDCFCAGNRKNKNGKWEPVIGCTLKACLNPDGTMKKPKDPPAYFWEH